MASASEIARRCGPCDILFDHKKSSMSLSTVGLPMDYVTAVFSKNYGRKIMPEYETEIDKAWQKKKETQSNLYNGAKFRLNGVTKEEKGIKLQFGLTCYKDFQCTNMQPKSVLEKLQEYGESKFKDIYACMVNPTFSTVLVKSNDDHIVMLKRSHMVGESPGMIDFPGGHMEPNVNLPESSMNWPLLLGIIRNNTIGGKPGGCFFISCSYDTDEIKKLYNQGGSESFESTEIIFIKLKDLCDVNSEHFSKLTASITTCAAAACELFRPYIKQM
ncbi:uridine diphosphate glucose pyrophosphatase NUDT22-like isoform X2 [Xenia sp. Carnegie-2017]|uniref:uridine diphosphate glucose pyrophosphatase NUDT22-like isoform X2 n=1 Tax=Xenia sp. Carnegie-2017 TaxID=2897299 RepID=UPI001F0468D1|nr:uridine diphosphate glucose pyrophosphatase NUDT22-like isoform X2 [Xenia sp. Carnegie-2017]